MQAESTKGKAIDNFQAEQDISYYQDKINTINLMDEHCTNPVVKEQYRKAIIYAMKCIQRIRLAQVLELEYQALMEMVRSN